ncbi:MAG: class I SAM-dependent methyltransferase [Myxococcales bacterium]|nr:class I SAM-dependent methyltransferase [Myxococcales bacterium]
MDYQRIYRERAEDYDRLVGAEDADGNLLPALEAVVPVAGLDVLDVGTGTGRLARLLVGRARRVVGVEPAPAMLAVARRHLEASGHGGWELHEGRADALPVESASADLVLAGWVLGHQRTWRADDWREAIGACLCEMSRCLRPGGTMVIIETLGTGSEEPAPPNAALADYFGWLEEQGFTRRAIRTDYVFPDVATAAAVCGGFFGEAFAERVTRAGWSRVPECTGLWSRAPLAERS